MKFVVAAGVLALALGSASPLSAGGKSSVMTAVPEAAGYCANKGDGMCYEWKLEADPSLRVIAYGFEDGIDYSFYRRGRKGDYRRIVDFHPVVKDAGRPNQLFWGYPWDIQDLAVAPDGRSLLTTFEHAIVQDGNQDPMPGQKRIPALLFTGRTTQPDMKVQPLRFQPATLDAMRDGAGLSAH